MSKSSKMDVLEGVHNCLKELLQKGDFYKSYQYFSNLCSFEKWLQFSLAWKFNQKYEDTIGWPWPEKGYIDIQIFKGNDPDKEEPKALIEVKTLWNNKNFTDSIDSKKNSIEKDLKKLKKRAKKNKAVKIEVAALTYHCYDGKKQHGSRIKLTLAEMKKRVCKVAIKNGFKKGQPFIITMTEKDKTGWALKEYQSEVIVFYQR